MNAIYQQHEHSNPKPRVHTAAPLINYECGQVIFEKKRSWDWDKISLSFIAQLCKKEREEGPEEPASFTMPYLTAYLKTMDHTQWWIPESEVQPGASPVHFLSYNH